MIPTEPRPEDFARQLAERRASMDAARTMAFRLHSQTGLMARFVRRLADRIDPTGAARRGRR